VIYAIYTPSLPFEVRCESRRLMTLSHMIGFFCLKSFGVHAKIIKFLQNAMGLWATKLTVNDNLVLDTVPIHRGIFQGDSLSPLLFIMYLAPFSDILTGTKKGYHLSQPQLLII